MILRTYISDFSAPMRRVAYALDAPNAFSKQLASLKTLQACLHSSTQSLKCLGFLLNLARAKLLESPQIPRLSDKSALSPHLLSPDQQHNRSHRQHQRRKPQHRARPLKPQHAVDPPTCQRQPCRHHVFPKRHTTHGTSCKQAICVCNV